MPRTVELHGNGLIVTFGTKDAFGVEWHVAEVEGWFGAGVRRDVLEPPATHGGYLAESIYGPRALLLRGNAYAASETAMWAAIERLGQASDLVVSSGILVVNEPTPKRCDVNLAQQIRARVLTDRAFEYEVPLEAMDPRKYAVTVTSTNITVGAAQTAASGTITNGGTFETRPTVTIAGGIPSTAFQLTNNTDANSVKINTAGAATGDTIIVDFLNRTVTRNGQNFDQSIDASSRWWKLRPGNNDVVVTRANADAGSSTFAFARRSAWT